MKKETFDQAAELNHKIKMNQNYLDNMDNTSLEKHIVSKDGKYSNIYLSYKGLSFSLPEEIGDKIFAAERARIVTELENLQKQFDAL